MATRILDIAPRERPYMDDNVLNFYDGPQIFWLPVPGERLLAFGLPEEAGHWPFLVVSLSEQQAQDLLADRLTLQAAVLGASTRYLMANYDAVPLQLEPVTAVPVDWLPGNVTLTGRKLD